MRLHTRLLFASLLACAPLAALAEEIQKNMVTINEVLVASGQEKIDLAELQATVKECQELTAQ